MFTVHVVRQGVVLHRFGIRDDGVTRFEMEIVIRHAIDNHLLCGRWHNAEHRNGANNTIAIAHENSVETENEDLSSYTGQMHRRVAFRHEDTTSSVGEDTAVVLLMEVFLDEVRVTDHLHQKLPLVG
ncbi:hypothetical protein D3C75_974940 [compost metagenome]